MLSTIRPSFSGPGGVPTKLKPESFKELLYAPAFPKRLTKASQAKWYQTMLDHLMAGHDDLSLESQAGIRGFFASCITDAHQQLKLRPDKPITLDQLCDEINRRNKS